MKHAKRFLAMLLALCLLLGLCACAGTNDEPKNSDPPTEATGQDEPSTSAPDNGEIPLEKTVALILQPGGLGDEGWNDASWAGLQRMMKERGIGGITVETSATADTEFFIRELAEKGYGLIYCLDTSVIPTCMQVSSDYPDSIFVYPAKLNHTYKVITKISRPNKGRLSFCPLNRGRVAAWGTAANRSCRMGHYARSVEVSCIRPFR